MTDLPLGSPPAAGPTIEGAAAVEIAAIGADRDVAIAAIGAETTEAVIEAEAEAGSEEDIEWLQNELGALRLAQSEQQTALVSLSERQTQAESQLAELRGLLTGLSQSTPPSPSEPPQDPPPPPPDPPTQDPEEVIEGAESAGDDPPDPPKPRAPPRRKRRWL